MADEDAEAVRPVGQVEENDKGKRACRCGVRDGASCCRRYKGTPMSALIRVTPEPKSVKRSLNAVEKLGGEVARCVAGKALEGCACPWGRR